MKRVLQLFCLPPMMLAGQKIIKDELNPRARQNVILELGYFLHGLGQRKGVRVLYEDGVELPSDIHGYKFMCQMDNGDGWKLEVSSRK